MSEGSVACLPYQGGRLCLSASARPGRGVATYVQSDTGRFLDLFVGGLETVASNLVWLRLFNGNIGRAIISPAKLPTIVGVQDPLLVGPLVRDVVLHEWRAESVWRIDRWNRSGVITRVFDAGGGMVKDSQSGLWIFTPGNLQAEKLVVGDYVTFSLGLNGKGLVTTALSRKY